MSRHGFSEGSGDKGEDLAMGRWNAQVKSATRGKRGQAFFRALVEALDALPEKRLVPNSLETTEGEVCALGCLARHRGVDVKVLSLGNEEFPDEEWEDSDWDKLSELFNIAPQLAREVMYHNDEAGYLNGEDAGSARWQQVRKWAARQIIPTEEELQS
jgi:hypothetical protein